MPDFTMSAEHLARTLAITKQRERERAIQIVESHLGETRDDVVLMAIVSELRAATPRLLGRQATPPRRPEGAGGSDGLPADREIPDDIEATQLARRLLRRGY